MNKQNEIYPSLYVELKLGLLEAYSPQGLEINSKLYLSKYIGLRNCDYATCCLPNHSGIFSHLTFVCSNVDDDFDIFEIFPGYFFARQEDFPFFLFAIVVLKVSFLQCGDANERDIYEFVVIPTSISYIPLVYTFNFVVIVPKSTKASKTS